MKLINANKLRKYFLDLPNCYNGFSDTYDKTLIIDVVDEQPTVKAIPIEWIKKWSNKNGLDCYDYDYPTEKNDWWYAIEKMLEDWEKENEID